ncbi:MAG: hypothetical protein E7667_06710 [Ruminococcaceae bacterium]|nr:hypothetical protein [Oscillospiraceae bacterium]
MIKNFFGNFYTVLAKEDMTKTFWDKLNFDGDSVMSIIRVIIGIAIGVVLASAISVYDKRYLGSFVRKLISSECTSAENAKTLYELGFDDKLGVRFALWRGYTYSRWVICVEEEEYNKRMEEKRLEFEKAHEGEKRPPKFKAKPFKQDIDTMRYYVPEERCDAAQTKFSAKGSNGLGIFIVLLVTAIILCVAIFALPKIFGLANNIINKK